MKTELPPAITFPQMQALTCLKKSPATAAVLAKELGIKQMRKLMPSLRSFIKNGWASVKNDLYSVTAMGNHILAGVKSGKISIFPSSNPANKKRGKKGKKGRKAETLGDARKVFAALKKGKVEDAGDAGDAGVTVIVGSVRVVVKENMVIVHRRP